MSATDLAATITTIYTTILTAAGLTATFAARVIGEVAERVELMFDDLEREDFVLRVNELVAEGVAIDVAAARAAAEIVDDALVEMARLRGGGWDALYGDETVVVAGGYQIDGERPDYYWGPAHEILPGDGLYLDGVGPVVVTDVSMIGDLVGVSYIDRGSMVHEAMGNLPAGVAVEVGGTVFHATDEVRVRR